MERNVGIVEVARSQVEALAALRSLVDDAHGRPVRDLFVGTSDPEYVVVIEKPTNSKIEEILAAAGSGPLRVRGNPAIGASKNQFGTQVPGCYLRRTPRRSVGRRYVPFPTNT